MTLADLTPRQREIAVRLSIGYVPSAVSTVLPGLARRLRKTGKGGKQTCQSQGRTEHRSSGGI